MNSFTKGYLRLALIVGSFIAGGQIGYAETNHEALGIEEMPEREMIIKTKSLRAETVSSATLTNMKSEEVPQTVNIITSELIETQGAKSLIEALRMDSSVETGGDMLLSRTNDQYSIRGFSGSDVQVGNMILPKGLGYNLDTALIENVEVVKGPIGSISGGSGSVNNAYGAGGSISLNLKKPEFVEETTLDALMRFSHHGQMYRLSIDDQGFSGTEDEGFAHRTIITGQYDRPFWLSNNANGGQRYSIAPIFRWQHDARTKTIWTTIFQYDNSPTTMGVPVLGGHIIGHYDAWYGSPSGRLNAKSLLTAVDFERKLEKVWTLRTGASLGYSDRDYNVWGISSSDGRGLPTEYYDKMIETGRARYEAAWSDMETFTWGGYANALAEYKTGQVKHETLIGVSYTGQKRTGNGASLVSTQAQNSKDYLDLYNPAPIFPAPREYSRATATDVTNIRFGVLLQDILSYGNWRFLAGVRADAQFYENIIDDVDDEGMSLSPRVGVTRMLWDDRMALFSNWSRTSSPNFGYLDEFGNPLTNSWRADQMEFGFRINPVDKVWFTAAWFNIRQDNTPMAIDGYTDRYYTDGSKRVEGVELSLVGEITENWSSYLSYTYKRTKNRNTGSVDATSAPNSLALWQKYHISGGALEGTVIGLGFRWKDKYYSTFRGNKLADNYTIPSYCVFDLTAEIPLPETRWFKDATLRLGVYNLFDREYIQSTRHAVQCTVGEPRTFEIGLRTTF